MNTLRVVLAGGGAALQLGGALAVTWPDVLPYRDDVSRWLRTTWQRLVAWVRRLLHLSKPQVVEIDPGRRGELRCQRERHHGGRRHRPDRAGVRGLRRRAGEAEAELRLHMDRLGALEDDVPRRLDELRHETHERVDESITEAEARYRTLRTFGAIPLALGLTLTRVAAFL